MARIYAAAFPEGRAWSASELSDLIDGTGGFAVTGEAGFSIGRAIAGECELITLAVDPSQHRKGQGRDLLSRFEAEALRLSSTRAFLEVAEDNRAALALYHGAGWSETGRRREYYARRTGPAVDAILMSKPLG